MEARSVSDKIIASMEAEARAFLAELEDKLTALERKYPVEDE
jgi:hypothetical protein